MLIFANPAAEMWRLVAIETTLLLTFHLGPTCFLCGRNSCSCGGTHGPASSCCRCAVQSTQCSNRGIQSVHLLCCSVPLSFQLRDYVHVFASGEDCSRYSKLRGSLHQREQHSQCIVKLFAFLRTESMSFLYSVLMNRLTCGLDTFRKFSEIEFDKSSVVQILPRGMGHIAASLPGVQGSVGEIPGILRLGSSHPSTFSHVRL